MPAALKPRQSLQRDETCEEELLDQPDGHEVFQQRLRALETQGVQTASFNVNEKRDVALVNGYKGRKGINGTLLHFAIERDAIAEPKASAAPSVERVLKAGASYLVEASYHTGEKTMYFQAIHLAAGLGLTRAIELLHAKKADVNKKTRIDQLQHYCPLHEACFLGQTDVAQTLLGLGARPDETNTNHETALHIVAKGTLQQHVTIAELLVDHRADLNAVTKDDETPLHLAIKVRRFPPETLHILAPFCHFNEAYEGHFFADMASICRFNVPAAQTLIKHLKMQFKNMSAQELETHMRDVIFGRHRNYYPSLTAMIEHTPDVALDLLDLFCSEPIPEHPAYHPLPRVVNFQTQKRHACGLCGLVRKTSMLTSYVDDTRWRYHVEQSTPEPPWHKTLAPPPLCNRQDSEAVISIIRIPNLIDLRIVHALNLLDEYRIFNNRMILAYVSSCWKVVVLGSLFRCLMSMADVSILTYMASWSTDIKDMPRWKRLVVLMFLWAAAFRESFQHIHRLVNHRSWEFEMQVSLRTITRVGSTALLLFLVNMLENESYDPESLIWQGCYTMNIVSRYWHLTWSLCYLKGGGSKLLAIMFSLLPGHEMIVFLLIMFSMFMGAFSGLGRAMPMRILWNLFVSVFTADGEGFNFLMSLDHGGVMSRILLLFAIFFITIVVINLMIAIYGNTYNFNFRNRRYLLAQERLKEVEFIMMMPVWRGDARHGVLLCVTACGMVLVSTVASLWISTNCVRFTGSLLAMAQVLIQKTLVQDDSFNMDDRHHGSRRGVRMVRCGATSCTQPDSASSEDDSCETTESSSYLAMDRSYPSRPSSSDHGASEKDKYFLWICEQSKGTYREDMENDECSDIAGRLEKMEQIVADMRTQHRRPHQS